MKDMGNNSNVTFFRLKHPMKFGILRVCRNCKHFNTDYDMPFCTPGIRTPAIYHMGCSAFEKVKK